MQRSLTRDPFSYFIGVSVLSTPYEDDRIDFTIADIPLLSNLGYISTASFPMHCKVFGEALKGAVVGQVSAAYCIFSDCLG